MNCAIITFFLLQLHGLCFYAFITISYLDYAFITIFVGKTWIVSLLLFLLQLLLLCFFTISVVKKAGESL